MTHDPNIEWGPMPQQRDKLRHVTDLAPDLAMAWTQAGQVCIFCRGGVLLLQAPEQHSDSNRVTHNDTLPILVPSHATLPIFLKTRLDWKKFPLEFLSRNSSASHFSKSNTSKYVEYLPSFPPIQHFPLFALPAHLRYSSEYSSLSTSQSIESRCDKAESLGLFLLWTSF